jgi:hypothetical protein
MLSQKFTSESGQRTESTKSSGIESDQKGRNSGLGVGQKVDEMRNGCGILLPNPMPAVIPGVLSKVLACSLETASRKLKGRAGGRELGQRREAGPPQSLRSRRGPEELGLSST